MGQSSALRVSPFSACLSALAALAGTLAFSVLAQSPADGPWSGQIQCQADVQQEGYSRRETQTWTLTGNTPISKSGAMQIYPATWSVSGQGSIRRAQEARTSSTQWAVAVPPTDAPLAMFVRASDGKFIIRQWHSLATRENGVTGTREIVAGGATQQSSSISSAASEWPLPWIETTADANITGSLSVPISGLGAELTPAGQSSTATCTWRFSRAASSNAASTATGAPAVQTTLGAAGAGQVPRQLAPNQTTSTASPGNQSIGPSSGASSFKASDCAAAFSSLAADIQQAYEKVEQAIETAYAKLINDQQNHIAQLDAAIAAKQALLDTPCPPRSQVVFCAGQHTALQADIQALQQEK
ncbi:MAG TPA: hypothetical protein VL131_14260, partial [Gammaproteobacteria bacterium]|nr:hypothetical protein [Gammaproteobacteria bacterium]